MKRRNFLTGLATLSAVPTLGYALNLDLEQSTQKYIEILKFKIPFGPSKDRVSNFYKNAAISALNKIGISPVGIFSVAYGLDALTLCVIQQHSNLESAVNYNTKLMDDSDFRLAAKEYLETPFSNPAFLEIQSTLYKGFKDMPSIEVPTKLLTNSQRIYELRTYQSHSYLAGQKKIEMFNEAGEIKLFQRLGFKPVFFGEAILGEKLPSLSYMFVFENMTQRDKYWETFRADAEWLKLKSDPQYKDTVSCITDIILKPSDFSQI